MASLNVEKVLAEYPYFKDIVKYTLFTTEEDYKILKNGPTLKVDDQDVSIEFLKRILQDENYYKYALSFFQNEINCFNVSYIINGDTGGGIGYSKPTILKAFKQLIAEEKITLNEQMMKCYQSLNDCCSFDKFLHDYSDKNYEVEIDGNKYNIPVIQLIELMQMPENEFDDICANDNISVINGINKSHFLYAAYNYFSNKKVLDEYDMPDVFVKRMQDIGSMQKIDIQAINTFLVTEDVKYLLAMVSEELKNAIISEIPQELSDLEKAIYIYIKMCKLLTYDDEYFAVNQRGPATVKHHYVEYVSSINLSHNQVVCFEFNIIYAKLLSELGIKFKSNYVNMVGEAYGEGHAYLVFRSGKFLVKADSVTSILNGDIVESKLNHPLEGLYCLNKNDETRIEFSKILSRIYELVASMEKENRGTVEHVQTLEDLLTDYSQLTTNFFEVDLEERLNIMIEKVNSLGFVGIDSLSYLLQLRKILFTEEQRNNNFKYTIIRNNLPVDQNKFAAACAVFAVNAQGINEFPDENSYFYYEPGCMLTSITKQELQERFNNGIFGYVDSDDPKIPGIEAKGEVKR